jgi:bifunctional UDP-N-acetylglucosamine pyrophosphorylase/glucosamine-1-phosphate N-acetyltransferase
MTAYRSALGTRNSELFVLVLAAGKGTRMKSSVPKVLHEVAGRSLLEYVLSAARKLRPAEIGVVLGEGRDQVQKSLLEHGWKKITFITQKEQLGTGHAVMQARSWLKKKKGVLLVVYGDTPLLTAESLKKLLEHHASAANAATFLAMDIPDPFGYGRIMLDESGLISRIVEEKDAAVQEKKITLVNSGVACWNVERLLPVLSRLRADNAKKEYYLTDAAMLLRRDGHPVGVAVTSDPEETHGVNSRVDLARAEKLCRRRINACFMLQGVTMQDPESAFIDIQAAIEPDTRIGPGVVIKGNSKIGPGCDIRAYSIIEDSVVKAGAKIGPFAHLRAGSFIEEDAHIGNFVETKKTRVGRGSKANHLTYLGDTKLGEGVNIGAGTITCNYDGFLKSKTVLEDDVFVGSNSNLVAPVRVGRGAIIGAGSTITENVPPDSLALERAVQVTKREWAARYRKKRKDMRRMSSSPLVPSPRNTGLPLPITHRSGTKRNRRTGGKL